MKVRSPDSSDTLKIKSLILMGTGPEISPVVDSYTTCEVFSKKAACICVCERLNYTLYDSQHCLRKPGMKSGRSKSR